MAEMTVEAGTHLWNHHNREWVEPGSPGAVVMISEGIINRGTPGEWQSPTSQTIPLTWQRNVSALALAAAASGASGESTEAGA